MILQETDYRNQIEILLTKTVILKMKVEKLFECPGIVLNKQISLVFRESSYYLSSAMFLHNRPSDSKKQLETVEYLLKMLSFFVAHFDPEGILGRDEVFIIQLEILRIRDSIRNIIPHFDSDMNRVRKSPNFIF